MTRQPQPSVADAISLLDRAMSERDDFAYAESVFGAADIATALERSAPEDSLPIWERIAHLDGDRIRMWELVDHAKNKLRSAGISGPPTIEQEHEGFLASLPLEQRCLMQVRQLQQVAMSFVESASRIKAATRALELLSEYEGAKPLSKKQLVIKMSMQDVLRRLA